MTLTGCATAPGPRPSAGPESLKEAMVAVLLQNTIGGHRVDGTGVGHVLLVGPQADTLGRADFMPIDQPTLIEDRGQLFWAGDDGVHLWDVDHRQVISWEESGFMSPRSHLIGITPTNSGVLVAVDGGAPNPDRYVTGLASVSRADKDVWVHEGWLGHGVVVEGDRPLGLSSPTLLDPTVTLTDLTPGDNLGALAAPLNASSMFGRLVSGDGLVVMLHAPRSAGRVAQLWTHDLDSGATDFIALQGDGADLDVADWHVANVPHDTQMVHGRLYWMQGAQLWSGDPLSGECDIVSQLPGSEGTYHFLSSRGAVSVRKSERRLDIQVHDLESGDRVSLIEGLEVDGPGDLLPLGAVRLG